MSCARAALFSGTADIGQRQTVYWQPELETMSRSDLAELQLEKLHRIALPQAFQTASYSSRLLAAGFKGPDDIKTMDDFRRLPFTKKDDLRDAFPYGLLAVPRREVVRMHASSGTTGIPTVIYHNRQDLANWTNLVARSITATGCTPDDVFQNMMTYGLFTGGLGLHYGAEKVGMMVIPAGPGNSLRQFKLMQDFGSTVVHATPSYLLHLHGKIAEEGIDPASIQLRKAFTGAEPHTEDLRRRLEQLWNMEVYNSYGLSEMNGPGVAFECSYRDGMHLWEDCYIMEIIDPVTLEVLPDGAEGELVLTPLDRLATPLLRYRTRDLTHIISEPCKCGRTHRRIARIKGRSDDMLIINGVNVFPSQIEEVIMRMPEIHGNYQILVEKDGALDRMTVKTEVGPDLFSDDTRVLKALKDRIKEQLKTSIFISPVVELHEPGSLPTSEGKAKRVLDTRE